MKKNSNVKRFVCLLLAALMIMGSITLVIYFIVQGMAK